MGKATKIRLTPEEVKAREEANRPPVPMKLTPKQEEQLAFINGNRRTRRKIAKRNRFFRDRTGQAWRDSNEIIRETKNSVNL